VSAAAEQVVREAKDRALFDPEWFLEWFLHEEPDPWQVDAIQAIADVHRKMRGLPTVINHKGLNRITIRSCHGPGKTHWLAQVMHWWNFVFYAQVVCTAPKEKQLKTRLWPRYRKILRGSESSYAKTIKVTATEIRVLGDEDWGCTAETASDPENLQGYHDEPQLFLVDEGSARVLDPMFPAIEGTLTTPGSVLAMIGNPTRTSGEFHASHTKSGTKELYFQMHVKPEDSRFVDPKWCRQMARKYGKRSPVYKVRVLGEFAGAEENQLIVLDWIEDAKNRDRGSDGSIPKLRISVDVADGGENETVVTAAHHYHSYTRFLKQRRFSHPPAKAPIMAAEEAVRMFDDFGGQKENSDDDFVVDSLGVGSGTAGILLKGGYSVVIYRGGEASDDPKQWRNRRTQTYLVWRDAYRDGTIDIADDFHDDEEDWEDFIAQVCSVHSKPGTERVEDLETKEEMKRRNIESPDMSDSGAMQYATQAPEMGDSSGVLTLFNNEASQRAW
jgi:phage terminase large subunit